MSKEQLSKRDYNFRPKTARQRDSESDIDVTTSKGQGVLESQGMCTNDIRDQSIPYVNVNPSRNTATANKANAPTMPNTVASQCDNIMQPTIHDQMTPFVEDMRDMLRNLSIQLNEKLDRVVADMSHLKRDLAETKATIGDIEKSLTDTSTRVSDLETKEIPHLKENIRDMKSEFEEKLLQFEIHDRKQNLLIYGVPQTVNENIIDTVNEVFTKVLGNPREIPLINAHRLPSRGKAEPITSGTSRPGPRAPDAIIVRFARMFDRDQILHAYEQPRPPRINRDARGAHTTAATPEQTARERISIRSDLPPALKRERARLASLAFKLRKEKHLMTRIKVMGTKVVLQTRERSTSASNVIKQWSTWNKGD